LVETEEFKQEVQPGMEKSIAWKTLGGLLRRITKAAQCTRRSPRALCALEQ